MCAARPCRSTGQRSRCPTCPRRTAERHEIHGIQRSTHSRSRKGGAQRRRNIGSGQHSAVEQMGDAGRPGAFDKPVSLRCCDHIKPAGTPPPLAPPKRCSRCARPVPWRRSERRGRDLRWCWPGVASVRNRLLDSVGRVASIIPRTHRTLL